MELRFERLVILAVMLCLHSAYTAVYMKGSEIMPKLTQKMVDTTKAPRRVKSSIGMTS